MKRLTVLFALACLIVLATPVYAWLLVTQTGDWEICTLTHWKKTGWNEGYAEWNETVNDFGGFWMQVNITRWENWKEWYQIGILSIGETSNDFYIKIKLSNGATTLWIVTYYHGQTAWFGLYNALLTNIGASINATDWGDVETKSLWNEMSPFGWDVIYWNPTNYQLFVKNEGASLKVYWIFNIKGTNYAKILTFNTTLTGTVTATLIYQHGGQGVVEGYAQTSFTPPSLPPYTVKPPKDWWQGIFDFFYNIDWGAWGSMLYACLAVFFSFVQLSLPLLGFFALFWILDVIFTALTTGKLYLIGNMLMTIYDFVRGIIQTLVNIAQFVWSIIKFW